MNARAAIAAAKQEFAEVFQIENLRQVGLEEIEFDENGHVWRITLGFYRAEATENAFSVTIPRRTYKIPAMSDSNGKLISVKNREPAEA